jgi:hypothetical protein
MQTATLDELMEAVSALSREEQVELQNRLALLLEVEEDKLDLEDALRAEAEALGEPTIPWQQVKQGLGL